MLSWFHFLHWNPWYLWTYPGIRSKIQETWVWFLGQEDPWGRKWQFIQAFFPGKSDGQWTEELGSLQSRKSQRVRHDWLQTHTWVWDRSLPFKKKKQNKKQTNKKKPGSYLNITLVASPTQWTWAWANSGRWWRTGKPGMMQSIGSQRVRHDWATERHLNINFWIIHFLVLIVKYTSHVSRYICVSIKL